VVLATCLAAASAMAGNLILRSPTEGSFLGVTNSIQFSITEAKVQVTVTAKVTGPGGTTTLSQQFTPDGDGRIDQTIPLNFAQGMPSGEYTIVLSATEPGNTYASQTVTVQVDVQRPKFFSYSPYNNAYVKGIVKIRALITEQNIKDWRVRINGQDIPNNTGGSNTVAVDWDTSLIERDGENTIEILARDGANNEASLTIPVTLDRIKPTITIVYPRTDTRLIPNTNINVTVDVADGSVGSVNITGLDVVVRKMDGTYITRVAVISTTNEGSTLKWIGRIRYRPGLLPSQFKIVVTAYDRAGNQAVSQEVTLKR
jgi:hypothetical protein